MNEKNFFNSFITKDYLSEIVPSLQENYLLVDLEGINEFASRVASKGGAVELNFIGTAIKNRRKELDLTLEEVSNHICCLAYLSKLERNQVSVPNSYYATKICERLNLNYRELEEIKPINTIEKILKHYLNDDIDEIIDIVGSLQKQVFVAGEELCKAFACVLRCDLKEFNRIMLKVNEVKNTLSTEEVIFMLFVMTIYFKHTMQYRKCYQYLLMLNMFNIKNVELRMLIQEIKFYTMVNLNKERYKYEYLKLKSYFDSYFPESKQFKIKMTKLICEDFEERIDNEDVIESESYKHIININEKDILPSCNYDYLYTKAYLLLTNNHLIESIRLLEDVINKMIIDNIYDSFIYKFVALFGLATLMIKREEKKNKRVVLEFKNKFDEYRDKLKIKNKLNDEEYVLENKYESFDEDSVSKQFDLHLDYIIHISFIDLMSIELEQKDPAFIANFIKYRFLYFYNNYQFLIYKCYIDMRYLYLLGLLSRYKDAYLYCLNSQNVLKNTQYYCIINDIK
ncbi:MAG: helix-turn-helix transcriptional regulator [Bacilli bacterium]|nr:helix-turn-helix transcriptional regulator [Bacilli bacterium]